MCHTAYGLVLYISAQHLFPLLSEPLQKGEVCQGHQAVLGQGTPQDRWFFQFLFGLQLQDWLSLDQDCVIHTLRRRSMILGR